MKRIQISQILCKRPDFKNSPLSKEKVVLNWLLSWLEEGIKNSNFTYGDLIPKKQEFASFFGVSVGTVQNAIRTAEELGYFESKQSIGTMIKDPNETAKFEKMSSKKDKAVSEIKRYILENKIRIGEKLPNVNLIAKEISTSANTVRLALDTLERQDILDFVMVKGNKSAWLYKTQIHLTQEEKNLSKDITNISLIQKTTQKILEYILDNYKVGDKILPNETFAKMFNVSIRTVNEATRALNASKIILSRRGQYGTIFLNDPKMLEKRRDREEKSIFMSRGKTQTLQNSYMYSWETTLEALKKYIIQNHQAGDKIPPMAQLAPILGVSTNTIRRAINLMCQEGYLIAQRGKYGGVFILELPEKQTEAFTWLAINPSAIKAKSFKD